MQRVSLNSILNMMNGNGIDFSQQPRRQKKIIYTYEDPEDEEEDLEDLEEEIVIPKKVKAKARKPKKQVLPDTDTEESDEEPERKSPKKKKTSKKEPEPEEQEEEPEEQDEEEPKEPKKGNKINIVLKNEPFTCKECGKTVADAKVHEEYHKHLKEKAAK
jgi:hypothetical protein